MKSPAGRLIILMNEDKLNGLIDNMKLSSSGLSAVIDSAGNFVGSKDINSLPAFLEYSNLTGSEAMFYDTLQGQKVAVSHAHSDINDWEYVNVIPTDIYLEKSAEDKDHTLHLHSNMPVNRTVDGLLAGKTKLQSHKTTGWHIRKQ